MLAAACGRARPLTVTRGRGIAKLEGRLGVGQFPVTAFISHLTRMPPPTWLASSRHCCLLFSSNESLGLFPISAAKRFLDTTTTEDIDASSKALLSGLFNAMQAKTIYFKYGMHPKMRELMAKGLHDPSTRRLGGGGTALYRSGDDDESLSGESRVVCESVEDAAEICATRLAKLPEFLRVPRGISFGIEVEAPSPDPT